MEAFLAGFTAFTLATRGGVWLGASSNPGVSARIGLVNEDVTFLGKPLQLTLKVENNYVSNSWTPRVEVDLELQLLKF